MRVCEKALSGRDCSYGHLWATGTPYAIHSHPFQGTSQVRDGRSLDRVLPLWPGYVEFGPSERELLGVATDLSGDAHAAELGLMSVFNEYPGVVERTMAWAREFLAGDEGEWRFAEPAWDDRPAGGSGFRCFAESAGHRCELSAHHPLRHGSHGRADSGAVVYTYAW